MLDHNKNFREFKCAWSSSAAKWKCSLKIAVPSILENTQERDKKMLKKGKIFENFGKNIQILKIF